MSFFDYLSLVAIVLSLLNLKMNIRRTECFLVGNNRYTFEGE